MLKLFLTKTIILALSFLKIIILNNKYLDTYPHIAFITLISNKVNHIIDL